MSATITNEELVRRLEQVERRLDELASVVRVQKPQPGWLDSFCGMFADEPAFKEVIEYGRQFRNADRPPDGDEVNR
jgi:hypothetical protein